MLAFDLGTRLRCVVAFGQEPVQLAGFGDVLLHSDPGECELLLADQAAWTTQGTVVS